MTTFKTSSTGLLLLAGATLTGSITPAADATKFRTNACELEAPSIHFHGTVDTGSKPIDLDSLEEQMRLVAIADGLSFESLAEQAGMLFADSARLEYDADAIEVMLEDELKHPDV